MKIGIIFIVLILYSGFCYADWYMDSNFIDSNIEISANLNIIPEKQNYNLEYVNANVSFVPLDLDYQKILNLDTMPYAQKNPDNIYFTFNKPKDYFGFRINASIRTINNLPEINKKIKFPIQIKDELKQYTLPTKKIDSDNLDILFLASTLAEGHDDLYELEFELASWVKKNINYTLSTLTSNINQNASWVLQNRYGVCDELTNLFIAFNRALGIPARFISGIAYTNSELFTENWGPHGWAEVYFPDYGWIPFDVTYGEIGFIDPTHIKLKESFDGSDSIVHYTWLGYNVNLDPSHLDISTELLAYRGIVPPVLLMDLNLEKSSVKFGSYNIITCEISNPTDYYIATEVTAYSTSEIQFMDDKTKPLLLKPQSTKQLYWIIKVNEELNSGYSYTFPVAAFTLRNQTGESSFIADKFSPKFNLDDMKTIIQLTQEEEIKVYSKNIDLDCNADEYYNIKDGIQIECLIKNTGNSIVKDLNLCFDKCINLDLFISQEKNITLNSTQLGPGLYEKTISATNDFISKKEMVYFTLFDEPNITINITQSPDYVSFDEDFIIGFTLERFSFFQPKEIKVTLSTNSITEEWMIKNLDISENIELIMNSKSLKPKNNDVVIVISYKDHWGKTYSKTKKFNINLTNLNLWEYTILYIQSFLISIAGVFT